RALLADLARSGQVPARWAGVLQRGFGSPRTRMLSAVAVLALAAGVRWRAGGRLRKQRFTCEVRSLSDIIRDYDVQTIDVLKIDVEGSEWEVLAGMEPVLWPRVRQVVVEVHDVDSRVSRIDQLLQTHGFHTRVDQEDWALHPLLGIYTVYARRAA
ncbi:MAG TPA: FkbM family methyltransferase, partial [Chloroflexota bacterium]